MQKNRKFYALLTLFCAAALFFVPFFTRREDNPSHTANASLASFVPAVTTDTTAPSAATGNATHTTAASAAAKAAVEALKKETFTVLHADGKTKSAISCRDFLIFNLAAEMLPSFEPEALKAQAVASYTYFCYERAREHENPQPALCGADFADTPLPFPQAYTAAYWKEKWGEDAFAAAYPTLALAVDAVAGVQIKYRGKPILAAYHAMSPGKTEQAESVWAAAVPYLQSVDSAADQKAPDFLTTVRLSPAKLKQALKDLSDISFAGAPSTWISPNVTRSAAGTVLKLTVGGVALSGKECRARFGLRSACFSVNYEHGAFLFTVKGHGHGVGLSQYGAQFAAQNGDDYVTILHRYYTDVSVE